MLQIDPYFLNAEGLAAVQARAAEIKRQLEANRLLRATAQAIDVLTEDRREEVRPVKVDRRGAVTVVVGGTVVLRPRRDLGDFDPQPADVSAFMLDDQLRGASW